jgi:protein involved in polysaccharide export with SLBB domain
MVIPNSTAPEIKGSLSSCLRRGIRGSAAGIGLVVAMSLAIVALAGCSPQSASVQGAQPSQLVGGPRSANPQTNAQLDKLWQDRSAEQQDFPVGVGDVLEISISNVKELQDRTVKVDGEGNIHLPLVGSLHVTNLTEPEVSDKLADALHKYVYHPEISLSVKTYSSRVVGVMGAVRTPGLYVLNGPDDTVHDLIERAGGISDNAAHEVLLSPAIRGSRLGAPMPPQAAAQQSSDRTSDAHFAKVGAVVNSDPAEPSGAVTNTALDNTHTPWVRPPSKSDFDAGSAYVIELDGDGAQQYSNLPLRPGDTLFVPPAGQISVVGWVYHPTVMPVTHGLTALGAVSAAGGMMYASDPTTVKVIRREGEQSKVLEVDLAAVQKGEATDIDLKANDIVEVGYSTIKIPGYAFYYALQGIVSFAPAAALVGGL